MPTPAELRGQSRQLRLAAAREPDRATKRALAKEALRMAEDAEKLERSEQSAPRRKRRFG